MAKSSVAVLSDLHIGNNTRMNWYQASVHEPRLLGVLDWITANAASIRELVLLGDLVDIWTYTPDVTPPTVAEIIAANPKTLGKGGALAQAYDALDGKVTFLLGNHDGQITQQDLTALNQAIGTLNFVPSGIHSLTGDTGRTTTFAHGHFWTMFNAPDPQSPWDTMPIGHFVTRAFAYYLKSVLKPDQTAADLANMGSPNGFSLEEFLMSLTPDSESVAGALLNYVAKVSGITPDTKITLPGGKVVTYADAYPAYEDLFTRWAKQYNSKTIALTAACADEWGVYLGYFAQRLAIEQTSDLVIFGHTHQPVAGLSPSPVNAINSGFECVSVPDDPPKEFTFTMVDLDAASGQINYMPLTGGPPKAFDAPIQPPVTRLPMMPPKADCSCYITVMNTLNVGLKRDALPDPRYGMWIVPPPEEIPPGGTVMAWLEDDYDLLGSKGSFSYNNGGFSFAFQCAIDWPNACSGPQNNFVARVGAGDWGPRGYCPQWGWPLQIQYVIA